MIRVRRRMGHGVSRERLALEARRASAPLAIYLGLLALALLSLGMVLRNIDARFPWQEARTVKIAVADVSGVQPGTQDVRISGLKVGEIVDSERAGGHSVLELSLDAEHGPIYRNARLRLRPQTALQDMYVDVEDRGNPAAGELRRGEVLPVSRTETSVDTGAILNTLNGDTRARLESMLDGLGAGLGGRGQRLRAAFEELEPFLWAARRFTRETARRGALTRRLVRNLRLLTAELGARESTLEEFVAGGSATLGELALRGRDLDALLVELARTVEQLPDSLGALRGALDELDPALVALQPVASALPAGLSSLRAIMAAGSPAFGALRTSVRKLRPLATLLPPTAASLDAAFGRLVPQAPRFDRITARIVPCELAFQKFFQWTPSVFKFGDANGVIPRGDAAQGAESTGGVAKTPGLTMSPSCADAGGRR